MKDTGIINELLKKYDLVLPVLPVEQRRILRSKRKTLAAILSEDQKKSFFMSMTVRFYYMIRNAGLDVTLVTGARSAVLASVMAVMVAAGGSVLLVQNYIYRGGMIAEKISAGKGAIAAAGSDLIIKRGNIDIKSVAKDEISAGDEFITGDSSALLQLDNGAVVKILKRSSMSVASLAGIYRFDLKSGGILSRVPQLGTGSGYEIYTPDSMVKVKGTEFGVFYEMGKTKVIVAGGSVFVKHNPSGTEYEVSEANGTEVNRDKKVYPVNEKDLNIMKGFAGIQFVKPVDAMTDDELKTVKDRLAASDGEPVEPGKMTLSNLKTKYGKLDEVMLYNGKKYTGVIVSRGGVYKILTPSGTVSVNAKEIKGSRVIQ